MSTLERAISIAADVHQDRNDKASMDHVLHQVRVMMRLETAEERITAMLHHVLEEGAGWSVERLRQEGFSEEILAALDSVTRRSDEPYDSFLRRVARNPIGINVELAGLTENSDLSRVSNPTPADHERVAQYRSAIAAIRNILSSLTRPAR